MISSIDPHPQPHPPCLCGGGGGGLQPKRPYPNIPNPSLFAKYFAALLDKNIAKTGSGIKDDRVEIRAVIPAIQTK